MGQNICNLNSEEMPSFEYKVHFSQITISILASGIGSVTNELGRGVHMGITPRPFPMYGSVEGGNENLSLE
jgi:hypothetical protein